MMKSLCVAMMSALLIFPLVACAHSRRTEMVDVRVVSDQGRDCGTYRVYPRTVPEGRHYYLEAVKGERYSIHVTNRSDQRIGVVIAVDGRNIINGGKSELKPGERMYIIGPRETYVYDGWRTGLDRTNRFYFTDPSDSYSEKTFSDGSAMGTIALAVYREKPAPILNRSEQELGSKDSAGAQARPSLEGGAAGRSESMKGRQAGTGFGETNYSPARVVRFEPEGRHAERIVFKYEWRAELVKKGMIRQNRENRFWPRDGDFAPIPPDFRG